MSPYKILSEYNELKWFVIHNSFEMNKELYLLESHMQAKGIKVQDHDEALEEIDKYFQKTKGDRAYKGKLNIGELGNSKYDFLSTIRVVNCKVLLKVIEELMMKPWIEQIMTSNKQKSRVKSTAEIINEPQLKSSLWKMQTKVFHNS